MSKNFNNKGRRYSRKFQRVQRDYKVIELNDCHGNTFFYVYHFPGKFGCVFYDRRDIAKYIW